MLGLTGLQLKLATGALAIGAGAGASVGIAYEHYAPWALGPRLQRLQESLPGRDAERYTTGASAQRVLDQAVVESSWRPALKICRSDLLVASQTAATSIDAEREAATHSSDAAYRLGRASCKGTTNASTTPGSAAPVRLPDDEDLRSLVASGIGRAP